MGKMGRERWAKCEDRQRLERQGDEKVEMIGGMRRKRKERSGKLKECRREMKKE